MATHALPSARELADRVRTAIDATEWSPRRRDRTRQLKQRVWKLGFDLASECGVVLYPFAGLGLDLADYARGRLEERSAHFWPKRQEHSTLTEWAYDVAWVKLSGEYTAYSDDRDTAERVPSFERLVLALESELTPRRWDVLTDLNKLLCARADLRVMVWDRDALEDGFELVEPRLRDAVGADEGWWLLSGWGKGGFEHRVYPDAAPQGVSATAGNQ